MFSLPPFFPSSHPLISKTAEAGGVVVMAALHPPVQGGEGAGGEEGGAEKEGVSVAAGLPAQGVLPGHQLEPD